MSIDLLKKNIAQEKSLAKRLEFLIQSKTSSTLSPNDRKILDQSINATVNQIKILNDSLPLLINKVHVVKSLPSEKLYPVKKKSGEKDEVISISHTKGGDEIQVGIKRKDRTHYLEQLHIAEYSLNKLKKKKKKKKEDLLNEYKKASGYIRLSNQIFLDTSTKLVEKKYFDGLRKSLRKGNFMTLTSSYISMILLTTLISFFVGILIAAFFFFISLSLESPYIYFVDFAEITYLLKFFQVFWLIPITPVLTFLALYFYPSTEASSIKQNIDYELPFATIQMSAIAGADIEPSNIFKIIALSKEYPYIRNEAKKLMNQINLYGYDLSTALRNISIASPSKEWADLTSGISTIIKSGGDLAKYLNKKSESLLFDYRIKREKATKSAEVFMDIYISVVIAAPMLMMLLLIMINISNIGFDLSVTILTIIVVSVVSLINVIFLVFLHISQKKI